jgi:regulator of protease activity HflC (stomatin/prohibitin superfamily)
MFWFIVGIIVVIIGIIATICMAVEGNKAGAVGCIIATLIIAAILFGISCMANVPTGHTGVLTTFGKVEDRTLDAGMNFKAPWQNVVKMDNRVQKQSTDLICFSSDIQEVTMKYTVNYQISSANAMTIYKTIGTDYYNNIIVPNITESVKTEVAKYSAEALVSDRSALSRAIQENLTTRLAAYNIIVVSASIEDMDFTVAFTDAVEAKQVAEQNKLKAQTEAEQKVIEAEAAANVRKTQADAEAYEIRVKAEAEAGANKLLAESITQALIDYKYYETWNGELPEVMGVDTIIKMP